MISTCLKVINTQIVKYLCIFKSSSLVDCLIKKPGSCQVPALSEWQEAPVLGRDATWLQQHYGRRGSGPVAQPGTAAWSEKALKIIRIPENILWPWELHSSHSPTMGPHPSHEDVNRRRTTEDGKSLGRLKLYHSCF